MIVSTTALLDTYKNLQIYTVLPWTKEAKSNLLLRAIACYHDGPFWDLAPDQLTYNKYWLSLPLFCCWPDYKSNLRRSDIS